MQQSRSTHYMSVLEAVRSPAELNAAVLSRPTSQREFGNVMMPRQRLQCFSGIACTVLQYESCEATANVKQTVHLDARSGLSSWLI